MNSLSGNLNMMLAKLSKYWLRIATTTIIGFTIGFLLTTNGYLIAAAYLLGYLTVWKPCCWMLYESVTQFGRPTFSDLAMSVLFGSLLALAWPIVLVAAAGKRLYLRNSSAMIRTITPKERQRLDREQKATRELLLSNPRLYCLREDYVEGEITLEEFERQLRSIE